MPRYPCQRPTGSARGAGADMGGQVAGAGVLGTPGVSSRPASQGSAAAKALLAKGQSCLPGWATMAQLMPLARPRAHNDSAAEIWSSGLMTASRPLRATSLASVTDRPRRRFGGLLDDTSNQPETPMYRPCLAMTVAGSKAAQASALPPNSRAMVCALVPVSGPMLPAMSTNELNNSGCMTVRSSAHVPPMDQPTMPQCAGSGLTPNFEIMYGTTSLVR